MEYEGAVLDLDGTVYRGDRLLPGADDAVEHLRDAGLGVCFCSNNPTRARGAYAERLNELGIGADAGEVLSSGTITARFLAAEHPDDDLFVVGSSGLRDQLHDAGLSTTEDPASAAAVVVSFYRGFDYDSMAAGYEALRDGAPFYGTDPDVLVPADGRMVPGSGAILNAVAGVAGRDPDRVLGKPSAEAVDAVLNVVAAPPERCLVVGDRLDTDIALGERAGMTTALVLTGVSDRDDLGGEIEPDHVLDSLAEVERLL